MFPNSSRASSIFIIVGAVCAIGEIFQSSEMLLLLIFGVWDGLYSFLFVCLGDSVAVGIGADAAHISLLSPSSSVGIGADAAHRSLLSTSSSLVQLLLLLLLNTSFFCFLPCWWWW